MALPARSLSAFTELGVASLQTFGASLYDDFLPQLRGKKAADVWWEMSSNDATVGAILFAIEQLAREVEWEVEPFDESPGAEADAQFLEECRTDLNVAWADFISAALTELVYGWSFFEIVYKMRSGQLGSPSSQFSDGKIGWRKFAYRGQRTIDRFLTAPHGGG